MLTATTAVSLVVSWLIYSRASRSMSGAEVEVEPVEAELEDHADLRQCCATGGDRTALELRLGRVIATSVPTQAMALDQARLRKGAAWRW